MPAIITDEVRTQYARSFYSSYFPAQGTSNNVLYLAFGRETAWGLDVNSNNEDSPLFIVPVPDETTAGDAFRPEFKAAKKIFETELCPVIPRVNWTPGDTYYQKDVVITDEYNVYVCAAPSVTNNTKPTHTSGELNSWEFLYKISNPDYINNFVTADWIPVWYNGNVGTQGSPDIQSFYKSSCKNIMCMITLSDEIIPIANLNDFRKIALWSNPLDSTIEEFERANVIYNTDIDVNSGVITYVDHRKPVYREAFQVEEYRIILGF